MGYNDLINKYNVPGPRYTSYPTVPFWDCNQFNLKLWENNCYNSFKENKSSGISLYIHLPFCENLCTFCACNKHITKRHDIEIPYIKCILSEWDFYKNIFDNKPIISEIHIGGGTPTFFMPKNLLFLITSILSDCNLSSDYEFSIEGHPNNTTYEHLQVLSDLGFKRISFGVQDYDYKVQKAINRIQNFETVKNVTNYARNLGFTSICHDLIFGLPFQSLQSIINTIEFTKTLMPDRISFYSYAHVPWIKGVGQRGYHNNDLPSPILKRNMYERGKILLSEIGYYEIGMDHFSLETDSMYLKMKSGKLNRNFMGYTSSNSKLIIGLGASAISDCWYAFNQNIKNAYKYMESVNNKIIPSFRGHILTNDDMIIRKHILNLMCNMETYWPEDDVILSNINFIKEYLLDMVNDNLIEFVDNGVKVMEKGRPYIRNICMAFDKRMHDNNNKKRIFSMTI